jgi:hypothetical protein
MEPGSFPGLTLFSNDLTDALQFLRHVLVRGNDVVEGIGNLAG